jgi:secondary thiamine-phosphate synthase enzyme
MSRKNAHSHLMAMTLSTSEVVPVVQGQVALGTYQSVLFIELDGPRERTLLVQVSGEG